MLWKFCKKHLKFWIDFYQSLHIFKQLKMDETITLRKGKKYLLEIKNRPWQRVDGNGSDGDGVKAERQEDESNFESEKYHRSHRHSSRFCTCFHITIHQCLHCFRCHCLRQVSSRNSISKKWNSTRSIIGKAASISRRRRFTTGSIIEIQSWSHWNPKKTSYKKNWNQGRTREYLLRIMMWGWRLGKRCVVI